MTGQDLEDLIEKMDLNMPLRGKSEEVQHPSDKRVLISDNC